MPITYTIDRGKKLMFETWTGEVQAADLATYWKRLLADPEALEIRRTVVDLRASDIRFSGLEFESLIKTLVLPVLKDRKWTTAIVVDKPTQYGVSRQYQAFADRYSKDSIFHSVEEAEKWIDSHAS
jgi:hypothetical protein